jgi:hypothetical protein
MMSATMADTSTQQSPKAGKKTETQAHFLILAG